MEQHDHHVAGFLNDDFTPMDNVVVLGSDHYGKWYAYKGVSKAGMLILHKKGPGPVNSTHAAYPDSEYCLGSVEFPGWTLESEDPVTISPSVWCWACGDHGFVREGKWVPA